MAHVTVTISGKTYRMACGDGEEGHITGLAEELDARISQLREAFGEIGDMRLHVMAALMVADELSEARRKIGKLEREKLALDEVAGQGDARIAQAEEKLATAVGEAASRIARIAETLMPPAITAQRTGANSRDALS
jgi:cell division protein ZapA